MSWGGLAGMIDVYRGHKTRCESTSRRIRNPLDVARASRGCGNREGGYENEGLQTERYRESFGPKCVILEIRPIPKRACAKRLHQLHEVKLV